MESRVRIQASDPRKLKKILGLSLESDQDVRYDLEIDSDALEINVKTEGLGPLRGCTDTVFRLSSLVKKIY